MTKLITIPKFAQATGLSYRLCLQLVGTGQIPFVPLGRRRWIDPLRAMFGLVRVTQPGYSGGVMLRENSVDLRLQQRFVSERDLEQVTGISRHTWQKHRLFNRGPCYYKIPRLHSFRPQGSRLLYQQLCSNLRILVSSKFDFSQ